jgi:hypothetical protein
LTKTDFVELVDCRLDQKSYEKILRDEGHLR